MNNYTKLTYCKQNVIIRPTSLPILEVNNPNAVLKLASQLTSYSSLEQNGTCVIRLSLRFSLLKINTRVFQEWIFKQITDGTINFMLIDPYSHQHSTYLYAKFGTLC